MSNFNGLHPDRRRVQQNLNRVPGFPLPLFGLEESAACIIYRKFGHMPSVHFVADYEHKVDELLSQHSPDEAMKVAVGGHFDMIGGIEVDIIAGAGLGPEMSVLDLGCGSGRTAIPLAARFPTIEYTGIDVVQRLLDYAAGKCPPHFKFICHQEVTIPLPDGSIDIAVAFSLFTHLLHEETYCYLAELRRVLKPGGVLILSFLEFASARHWQTFMDTVAARRASAHHQLNMFFEEPALRLWADKIGFTVERIDRQHPIGQTLAFLR